MASISDKEIMERLQINRQILDMFKKVQKDALLEVKRLDAAKRKRKKITVLGISGSARDAFDMAREDSNSEELLERCLKRCKELGAQTELIALRKYKIGYCKACYSTANTQCHFYCSCYPKNTPAGDDMTNTLYDKIISADAIIFATPVNNFKISTLLATFLDRCISLDGSLGPANPRNPKDRELNIKHMKFVEMTADNEKPGSGMIRRFNGKVAGAIVTGHEAGAGMVISNLFMTLNHFGMIFPPFNNVYAMASICQSTYEDKKELLEGCYEDELKALADNVMLAAKLTKKTSFKDWKYDYSKN